MSWSDQFNYPMWNLVLWLLWAAEFAMLETLGVRNHKYPTLTYLCIHVVPTPVLAAFCGWLLYHFTVQYGPIK